MALTGQLSDMSLAELIEFFCNQRKTGRLKIDYPRGHSVFFIREGELVDARVGALSGAEAVYFSLTLPNAAFDFSPDVQATRRTIETSWTQVVLEGLRRLDEGRSPTEEDAFGAWSPSETEFAQMLGQVEHLGAGERQKPRGGNGAGQQEGAAAPRPEPPREAPSSEPLPMTLESAGAGPKRKFAIAGVACAVVLACAAAAVPLLNRPASTVKTATPAASLATSPAAAAQASAPEAAPDSVQVETAEPEAPAASADAAVAARREALERERRERERRERERREEAAARRDEEAAASDPTAVKPPAPAAAPAGPKSVRVSVTYDEAGRVTQASVAGATPGAEAYGSTAVRIARGRRFPAGKPGSTVVTIPVN